MELNRRTFLAAASAAVLARPAWACTKQQRSRGQCDPVPENGFQRGTRTDAPDCKVRLELPPDILKVITRQKGDPTGPAGSYDWTLRLMTFDEKGRVRWQQAHKVSNQPFKEQNIYFGTFAAVYVTCDSFTGWISTGAIRSCGTPTFRPVNWKLRWEDLDRRWPSKA